MTDDPLDAILSAAPLPSVEAEANAERIRARNDLVMRHQGLVAAVARKFARSRVPFEELMQLGQLGLMRAAEVHDPARGGAFSTIATYRIYTAILEGLALDRGPVRVPVWARQRLREFRASEAAMEAELGRPPTFDEVAATLDLTPAVRRSVRAAMGARRVVGSNVLDMDLVGDEADDGPDHPELRRALRFLPANQRRVIEARFGFDGGGERSMAEVAGMIGVTPSRVGQVEGKALGKLRAMLGA